MNDNVQRGDIWMIRFDPSEGDEIQKIRPAVVMTEAGVGKMRLQIVVPVTAWQPQFSRSSAVISGWYSLRQMPKTGFQKTLRPMLFKSNRCLSIAFSANWVASQQNSWMRSARPLRSALAICHSVSVDERAPYPKCPANTSLTVSLHCSGCLMKVICLYYR